MVRGRQSGSRSGAQWQHQDEQPEFWARGTHPHFQLDVSIDLGRSPRLLGFREACRVAFLPPVTQVEELHAPRHGERVREIVAQANVRSLAKQVEIAMGMNRRCVDGVPVDDGAEWQQLHAGDVSLRPSSSLLALLM
jgi:hypothetical protein